MPLISSFIFMSLIATFIYMSLIPLSSSCHLLLPSNTCRWMLPSCYMSLIATFLSHVIDCYLHLHVVNCHLYFICNLLLLSLDMPSFATFLYIWHWLLSIFYVMESVFSFTIGSYICLTWHCNYLLPLLRISLKASSFIANLACRYTLIADIALRWVWTLSNQCIFQFWFATKVLIGAFL